MDIAEMSIVMNQMVVQSAVSTSIMKMAMNNGVETATTQIGDMMNNSNMAVDISRGANIDATV
ncbi:motility protein [Clostridium beijerinckii]|uniref:Motility protein n=1 Tax=Clostridium beijerinckii TaxID=1520 RepID=A0A0B5QTF2_CLOBE|nr:putative motility protein [Clostridium beijerinckii]AJH01323.1 motility protein [Clostridium beijerinckii]